jgi:hypothetical protein
MKRDASRYNPSDATGFIRLNALRLKLRAALKDKTIDPFDFAQGRLSIARWRLGEPPVPWHGCARLVSTRLA